jgi:hypothetical protein
MRELTYESEFDGILMTGNTLGYFEHATHMHVLSRIFAALKPGGVFHLEVQNRDNYTHILPLRIWWEGVGCIVLEEVQLSDQTSRITNKRTVMFEDGQQHERRINMRLYALHELRGMFAATGFEITEISGSIFTPGYFFGSTSASIHISAKRPI